MRPTLRQLQYLVTVADCGRFSEAAKRLSVSQPSLSAQISEAEAHLGARIFERGRHGARITPVGLEVVRRARYVLRQVEDMKAVAKHGGQVGLFGRVRLGVLPTIGPYLLPRCTPELHRQFPDLRLGIREESTQELAEKLNDGRFDAIISTAEDHPDTDHAVLFGEPMWIALAIDDPLAQSGRPVDLAELQGRAFLTLGLGHRLTALVHDLARKAGAHISNEYEGTSLDAIRQMAALGVGTAVLPELYLRSEAQRDPALAFRPISDPGAYREISLLWRPQSPLAQSFTALAAHFQKAARSVFSAPLQPGTQGTTTGD